MSQDTKELTADVGTAAFLPDDVAEITYGPGDVLEILDTYFRPIFCSDSLYIKDNTSSHL